MLCRIMRKPFSTSRWLLNRAGLMDIFRWVPCITVSLLTLCLINCYQHSEDQNTLRLPTAPLFFALSMEIHKKEKIPTYMTGGIRQRLTLAWVLHVLLQELKKKIRDHSHFEMQLLLKPTNTDIFPRSLLLGQLACKYGHLFSILIVSLLAKKEERQTIFTDLQQLFHNDPR